ncbi:sensor histidine kinase [Curtobacterium sp. MCBD17_034]|nr:sensor histidine kinase [Curtobacterium sp. MCBD17_034]PZM40350.1 sensor histidine kinase [Curtobacterium sp. MCBD17_031]
MTPERLAGDIPDDGCVGPVSGRSVVGVFRTMLRSQMAFDVVLALVAAVVAVLGGDRWSGLTWLLGGLFGLALALRRFAPGRGLAIAWVGALVQMYVSANVAVADLMIPGVLYGTALYGSPRVRRFGLTSALVGSVVGALYLTVKEYLQRYDLVGSLIEHPTQLVREAAQGTGYFVVIVALLVLPWLAGAVARARGVARVSLEAQLLAERDAARSDRAVAVEQERVRIAREMHDIVAHSLAVVIAQADGARYAMRSSPESADAALATIGATARRALGDVRELLGALRHDEAPGPTPALDDIDQLVRDMRQVGLDVQVERAGEPEHLPTTSQLAVYRVVQEGLTNALKHGDRSGPVRLALRYAPDHVEVAVANRLPPEGHGGQGVGHGLVGMRERAALSGGTMSAGPTNGEFRVAVRLPTAGSTGAVPLPRHGREEGAR